jgi:serine-type D-Ala-D-Ala carboxypeptidase/endopeptidase (penicillin-binding protein 4)
MAGRLYQADWPAKVGRTPRYPASPLVFEQPVRTRIACLAVATVALVAPAGAIAAAPDLPGRTAPASAPRARAAAPIGLVALRRELGRLAARAGSGSGMTAIDTSSNRTIFARRAGLRLPLASNIKLFTTAAALDRFGAAGRLETSVVSVGPIEDGALSGSLYLVGGGDPALASAGFARSRTHGVLTSLSALAGAVRRAGIRQLSGSVFADDSLFDRRRGVPESGGRVSPYIGPLSALTYNSGTARKGRFARDPARAAAQALIEALRRRGVRVGGRAGLGRAPGGANPVGSQPSPPLARLVTETNRYSNNFFAEMLLKGLGARFGAGGTTAAGAGLVRRFANRQGAAVHAVDGSGLTRSNASTSRAVARFLRAMLRHEAHDPFVSSLPLAARQGTLRSRMRGSAAAGRCRAKTGTLTGVSALSGYCFAGGRTIAFSILMRGTELARARRLQDGMAALLARYRP